MSWFSLRKLSNQAPRASGRGAPRASRPRYRPSFELLEDRALPSTVNWIGGSGNWNDSSHWLDATTGTNHVPAATDAAVINAAGVTVTHGNSGTDPAQSITISDGTLSLTAGTLDVAGTLSGAGTFILSGGTLAHANVSLGITFTTTTGSTLSGVTLSNNQDMASASGTATVTGGLTLANNAVISLGNNTGTLTIGRLLFQGTETLGGTGTVLFGGSSSNGLSASGSAALTLGSNILVQGKNGSIDLSSQSFINQGTISSDVAGGTITVNGIGWSNTGTIQSSNGGNLTLNCTQNGGTTPWTNAGTISAAGGTLTLGRFGSPFSGVDHWSNTGTITASNNATVNLSGQFTPASVSSPGTFNGSGATVNLVSTLDNTGTTLALTATTGSWNLRGGTIMGGTVTEAGGAKLIFTSSGGTLDGVTFSGDLDLATNNNAQASVRNGLTLNSATINLGDTNGSTSGQLFFSNTQTLGGTGTVVLGASSTNSLVLAGTPFSSVTLTLGTNIQVHGKSGSIGPTGGGSQTLINQGTINADSGGTITLSAGTWSNSGTIGAQDSGIVLAQSTPTNFASGTLTGGTWRVLANGTLRIINANISTNAATILLDGMNSNFYRDSGTTGALANFASNTGSFTLQGSRNFTTAGDFTNNGTLNIKAGSTFTVNGSLTNFDSGSGTLMSGTYLIGGTLQFNSAAITTNAATIVLDGANGGAAAIVDQTSTDALANLSSNSGNFTIQGGRNFATPASAPNDFSNSGSLTVGANSTFTVNGAYTSTGGTLTVLSNGAVVLVGGGTSSGNVSNAGTLTVGTGSTLAVSGTFTQTGTLTLQSTAMVNLSGGGSNSGSLGIASDATLNLSGGSFTLASGTSFTDTGLLQVSGATVSIPNTLSIPNLELDSGTLNGAGAVTVTTAMTWTGGTQSGTGSTTLGSAGTLTLSGTGTRTLDGRALNLAGTTTWTDGGTLSLANSATLSNQSTGTFTTQDDNDKSVTGSGSFTSAGTLTKTGAGTTSVASGVSFSTGGTSAIVNVQTGTLSVSATYTQTSGGTTNLSSGAALTSAGGVSIQSGSALAGAGTINGDVTNAGQLSIGDSTTTGILTVNGNFTQTSGGTLTVKVGGFTTAGTDFDQLVLTAGHTATLAGTLNVTLVNGYTPTTGDSVMVITFDSATGTFATLSGDGSLFTANYDATDVTLVAI
jgi:fibronectin-binding autotransporter adhesin